MLNLVDDELIQILHENLSDKPSSIRNKQGNVSQLYKFITTMKKAKKMIEQVCFALKQSQAYNKALVIKFEKEKYEQKQVLQNQCATEIEHQSDMFKQKIKELRMEMEEQEIQIQKQCEEKLNKEENYEQQIKQLKRNLNDQRILYENKCAETQDRQEEFEQQLNQQINEWQQKLLNEQIQKDDLESQMERQKSQEKIYSTIDELEKAINTLPTQKTELKNNISQLKQQIEQQNQLYSQQCYQAQQQMEQLNQYYQQREQQIQQEQQQQAAQNIATLTQEKDTLIQQHKTEMDDHKRKFKQLKKDRDEQEEDYNNIFRQLQQTKQQLQETQKRLNHATQIIKQFDDEKEELSKGKSNENLAVQMKERDIKKLKVEITSLNKAIEDLQSVNDTQRDQYCALLNLKQKETSQFNEEKNELNEQITELTATIGNQKVQIEALQKQIFSLTYQYKNSQEEQKYLLKEIANYKQQIYEVSTKTNEEDNQKFRAEIEFKDIIIKKVCKNQQDKYIDKIIGPMEKIMNSEFKINRFADDPNSQRDNTEYIIYEISFDKIKASNLMKEQKWICFDECLKYQTLGSAKTIRSIQPNADVTLLKGYIIQIEEADNGGLKDKKLLRKEYKSQATPMLSTKEEAGKLSLNNLLCKFLFEKYNQMQGFPKIQGKQIQIQRQFVLQVKGKEEYCYCEMIVEEYPFEKINGGVFQVKDTDIHQYLNAFSLFTYNIMNRQLIISNLQVVGQYLHDMIVSTQYKIFTPIDQGSAEIEQTMRILEKAPQAALSKYWNEKIEKQVKQGWK